MKPHFTLTLNPLFVTVVLQGCVMSAENKVRRRGAITRCIRNGEEIAEATGTVTCLASEGGFCGIVGDEGRRYEADLPRER